MKRSRIARLIFTACIFLGGLPSYSQTNLVSELISSNYLLIKMNFRNNPKTLEEFTKIAQSLDIPILSYKMQVIINDTARPEHKRLLKGIRYKQKDTLVVYEWDCQETVAPYGKISKFRYNKSDSVLTFYDTQFYDIPTRHKKYIIGNRKFKVTGFSKNELVLLDLNYTDVKRFFYLKRKPK
ncbi:MAG: hypothetical protein ACXVPQ_08340 [Bacteroidia bacterium]